MRISTYEAVHAGITVTKGSYRGVELVLANGVGKVNAAICAQMLIDLYQPSAVAFSGVAGGPSGPSGWRYDHRVI